MNVQMPDGTIVTDVPENITQKELLARYNKFNAPKIETAGIGEALKGGAKRMLGSLETAITSPFGAEEAAKQGLARQEAITERPGASLEKVKQVYGERGFLPAAREVVSQVPSAIAEQFPNLAATIGGARLGAMAGSTFGPAGTVIGGIGGAFVPSLLQQTGSNLERQAQEGAPISGSGALGAAVPQAALDVFTDRLLFSRLMGVPAKTLGRADADAVVAKSIKRTLAEGTAKGVVAEVPTEVAQQMLERYQAGLSLTDEDARKEYADTAYQVALLGPLGAVGKLQERGEARGVIAQDVAAQQAAAQQAQRQATGVMEQQPLFAPQEMPIPEPTLEPAPISTIAPEEAVAEEPVPEGQGELFTKKGAPTKEAKASVEAARLQGLPAQIAELNQTPEGRAQLAGDMKTYFPDLTVQERNRLRPQIQAGTYGVEPVAPVEGTLTPEVLQSFDITPRSKQYKALAGASLADPTTYNLLTTAAATNTDFGVKANRILDAFPHYNPAAVQPDLFGAPYAPQTETQAEPVQPDLFGVPAVGTPPIEPRAQQGMGQPVQQQEAAPTQAEEPVGGGVAVPSGAPDGNLGQPAAGADVQPSALAPIPKGEARKAAAALKKEPVAVTWNYFSDTPYAKLSKVSKDRVKDAHAQGYLTQALADEIDRIEAGNARAAAAASATNKPEALLDETPTQAPITPVQQAPVQQAPVQQAPATEPTLTEEAAALPDIPVSESDRDEMDTLYKALKGKSLIKATEWLAENSPSKSHRIIARIMANRFKMLTDNGVKFEFVITEPGGTGYAAVRRKGNPGSTRTRFQGPKGEVIVMIQGTMMGPDYTGLNYPTILHELLHAATAATVFSVDVARRKGVRLPSYAKHVDELDNLVTLIQKTVKQRVKDGIASDIEEAWVEGRTNVFKDADELIAWGLTQPEAQAVLESIKLGNNKTLWSEFTTVIRNLLGIPASENTALSAILEASHGLLGASYKEVSETINAGFGKELYKESNQIDARAQAQAQQAIASMSGMYAQSNPQPVQTGAQVAANIGNLVRTNPSGAMEMMERKINAFRNKVVWRGATLADDIQRANDNAFRDAYGNVRADILMSQAENTQNITESVFTFGGVEISPDGSVHAKVADHSIDGVFRQAKTLADRIGADTARELITKTFYAWRAKALLTLPKNEWPINWQQNPTLIPTQAQINAGMAAFNQFPELQAMKTEFIGAKNEAVKFLRQADFLTEEKAKAFLADDSYAPWFRLKEYDDTLPGLGNMGRMVDLKQMQALKGGSEEVNDMLENMAQVVSWFVRSGVSNHTANRALNTMQEMGTATPQRSRPTGTNPDNIVMTYVDGKRMFWTVSDPLQLQAFQSVKAINSPVIKAMSKGLGTLRAGIVLFPAFPVRQVIMDTYRAYAQSGVEQPAKLVGKVFKSFLSGEAYKAMSDDILEMKKYGVVGSADFNLSDSTRGRAEAYGLQGPEKGITATWLRSPVYKALHNFAYSADLAVRLGVYRQTMEETGDKELAIARAREIINFQKSGNSELMLTLKQLIPFMGAYLQGTDVNYRSMIGRGNSMKSRKAAAAAFWGNMTTLAALTVAYTMSMSGDDEYEEQKGFITDRNFIIPGVGLLPVPPDIGFLSKVIPERITDYILQEGTDNPESVSRLVDGIRGAAGAAYLPPAAVYGITPAIELGLNKSFFTDIPIVGQHMQGLEPFQQYTSSTSELAKTAGGIANMSPMQIDYLLKAIGGTAGGALVQMFDVIASDGKIAREKNIILGTFQKKEVGGRYTEEFYETRELIDRTYNTVKALDELGDQAAVDAYLSRPEIQQRMGARPMIEQMNTMLQEVRKARAGIENDPSLTPDEKRQAVNELQAGVEQALKEAGIRKVRSEIE